MTTAVTKAGDLDYPNVRCSHAVFMPLSACVCVTAAVHTAAAHTAAAHTAAAHTAVPLLLLAGWWHP
jgi:hypothetical protein